MLWPSGYNYHFVFSLYFADFECKGNTCSHPNHLRRLVFTSFVWTEQTFLLLLLFFLHLFIIIFKCSCLCLLFSSCFSFIMFFVILLMKHLCSGGKVKKYIYSATFIWSLESLVSMFGIWLMLNNQLYDNSVIKKVIDPPAERVAPPSSTFTSHQ